MKRIFFILIALSVLILSLYIIFVEGIPIQYIITEVTSNFSLINFIRTFGIVIILTFPSLSINSFYYNTIYLIHSFRKTSNFKSLENNILSTRSEQNFNPLKFSIITNVIFGFLISMSLIGIIIAFLNADKPNISSDDYLILSFLSLFAFFGTLIIIDSIKFYKELQ